MKKFLLLCLLATGVASAQPIKRSLPFDSVTHKITYQGNVAVPGATQAELYRRAQAWFATSFGSAKSGVETDDRAAGKLSGTGDGGYIDRYPDKDIVHMIWRTITIQVKDGRFQYVFTNFVWGVDVPRERAQPVELTIVPADFDPNGKPKQSIAGRFYGLQNSAESQIASLRAAMTQASGQSPADTPR